MTAKRTPPPGSKPQPSLPHDPEREGGQAYAKEVEDYTTGVASPPTERVDHEADRKQGKAVSARSDKGETRHGKGLH
jgi:hypothetical protein